MSNQIMDLKCSLTRILYEREGFAICECSVSDQEKIPNDARRNAAPSKGISGQKIPCKFTALGPIQPLKLGTQLLVSGTWEYSDKYHSLQLRVGFCMNYVGTSEKEIVAYLSSSVFEGIGEKTAKLIYQKFGADTLEIIDTNPEKLLSIPGISEKKLKKIVESCQMKRALHQLARLLAPYGVSDLNISRIYEKFGAHSVGTIKEDPYRLCQIRGFGFKRADSIALSMGISVRSMQRQAAAILYTLKRQAELNGDLYLTLEPLMLQCLSECLNKDCSAEADLITKNELEKTMEQMLHKGRLTAHTNQAGETCIYSSFVYEDEADAAFHLAKMVNSGYFRGSKELDVLVEKEQLHLGIELDSLQKDAAVMALASPISIITGGPGTGKTSVLRVLIRAYHQEFPKDHILLAAPSGRAAKRIEEQTGYPASTIHAMLGIRVDGEDPKEGESLEAGLIIIDESSMIDASLLAKLMRRVDPSITLVFVGDPDQLPSVGAGNVLKELLDIPEIPRVKLTKIFRQNTTSIIPKNSQKIRIGDTNLEYDPSFTLISCVTEEDGAKIIRNLFEVKSSKNFLAATQVLAPMRRRGAACTGNLNQEIQNVVNPAASYKKEIQIGKAIFRVGDKIMQTRNTEDAFNGDIGYITKIALQEGEQPFSMTIQFSNREVVYDRKKTEDLVHAYAITIHKSQGSEFDTVIVPIFNSMRFFLRRNLIYTAVTRAKNNVLVVGQEDALSSAIKEVGNNHRNSLLAEMATERII